MENIICSFDLTQCDDTIAPDMTGTDSNWNLPKKPVDDIPPSPWDE